MKRSARISILAISVTGIFLAAGPADAALFLVFDSHHAAADRTTGLAPPGETVQARTGGRGAMGSINKMLIFYAPGSASYPDSVQSLAQLRALGGVQFAGPLLADDQGTGHITFNAPDAPGTYQLVAYCPECEASSAGRNVLPVGDLRVVPVAALPNTGASPIFAHPITLILLGSVLLFLRRRRSA